MILLKIEPWRLAFGASFLRLSPALDHYSRNNGGGGGGGGGGCVYQ